MTIQTGALRADLHALMMSPAIGLCEYRADPAIQRRVGRMLVDAAKVNELAAKSSLKAVSPKTVTPEPERAASVSDTKLTLKLVPKDRG